MQSRKRVRRIVPTGLVAGFTAGAGLSLLLLAGPAPAGAAGADVEAVRSCMEANAPRMSAVQTILVTAKDPEGLVSETRARIYWRRFNDEQARMLMRMEAPEDLAGAGMLMISPPEGNPEVHLYLPEIGRPKRVYSPAQLAGLLGSSDIQLEEVGHFLDLVRRPGLRMVGESSTLDGRPVWQVEATNGGKSNEPFERVVGFVDQEYCVPLRVEFYEKGDEPRKVLRADPAQVTRVAETWVPKLIEVEDLDLGSHSKLQVESIEVDVPIAKGLLTVKALPGPRR